MTALVAVILGAMLLALLWVWLAKVHGELARFHEEVRGSWDQLLEAVNRRREMIPYLIASVRLADGQTDVAEAIGNACDLALSTAGIEEQAKAEVRINAALARFLDAIRQQPALVQDASTERLRGELEAIGNRIEVLIGMYDRQVAAYNTKLQGPAARLLSLFIALKPAVPYGSG